jgi:transcriptional regulator with XRE-family HTH domain
LQPHTSSQRSFRKRNDEPVRDNNRVTRTPAIGQARPALAEGAAEVGARVRDLRRRRGISLSELARRAAVGKATLSGLEAGTRNPTLDTLHAVAAALDLPLTTLLDESPSTIRGTAVEMQLLRVFDDGPVTYELYRMRIPAGLTQESPAHHAGVTEHATVFAGVLVAGPLDHPFTARAGEHVEWAADVPHRYAAEGPTDVEASLLIRYPRPGGTLGST